MEESLNTIKLDSRGLVAAIAQHAETGEVLMLGYMNEESIKRTLDTGDVWFFSRSRSQLWHKGSTSGNYLRLRSAVLDCDGDAIVLRVLPDGPACHTGSETCFQHAVTNQSKFEYSRDGSAVIDELFSVILRRKLEPSSNSYTSTLLEGDVNRVAQKVIEEAGEAAIAGVTSRNDDLAEELGDLIYHSLVLLAANDMTPADVWKILQARRIG